MMSAQLRDPPHHGGGKANPPIASPHLLCSPTPSRLTRLRWGLPWLLQTLWTLPDALGYITGRAGVK